MRCIAWPLLISRSDMHATYSITRLLLFPKLAGISTGCLFLSISLETKGTQDTFWNVLLKTISVRWCIFYSAATKCCWNVLKNYSQIIFTVVWGSWHVGIISIHMIMMCGFVQHNGSWKMGIRSVTLSLFIHIILVETYSLSFTIKLHAINYTIAGPCCHAC